MQNPDPDMIAGQRKAAEYCNVTPATIGAHINKHKTLAPDIRMTQPDGTTIHLFHKDTLDKWNKARKPRGRKRG